MRARASDSIASENPCQDCALGPRGQCPAAEAFAGQRIARRMTKVIAADVDIFMPGEAADTVAVLAAGWGYRYAPVNGARQILDILIPGDVFDQDTVILPNLPSACGTRTLTAARVCFFDAAAYRDLLQSDRRSRHFLRTHLQRHQAQATSRLIDLARRRASDRIEHFLHALRARLAERGLLQGDVMPFPLHQEHLANALGMTTEHVNRTLMSLREAGALELRPGAIRLPERLGESLAA